MKLEQINRIDELTNQGTALAEMISDISNSIDVSSINTVGFMLMDIITQIGKEANAAWQEEKNK